MYLEGLDLVLFLEYTREKWTEGGMDLYFSLFIYRTYY